MKTTNYFEYSVMVRRPYLKQDWLENVINNPIYTEMQANGRIRYWGYIEKHEETRL